MHESPYACLNLRVNKAKHSRFRSTDFGTAQKLLHARQRFNSGTYLPWLLQPTCMCSVLYKSCCQLQISMLLAHDNPSPSEPKILQRNVRDAVLVHGENMKHSALLHGLLSWGWREAVLKWSAGTFSRVRAAVADGGGNDFCRKESPILLRTVT